MIGPAPASVTDKIYEISKSLSSYEICKTLHVDIGVIGVYEFHVRGSLFTVQVHNQLNKAAVICMLYVIYQCVCKLW